MVYNFFDKKSTSLGNKSSSSANTSGDDVKSEIVQNKELAKEPHKLITRKFEKRKEY